MTTSKRLPLFVPVLLLATSAVSVQAQVQTDTPPITPPKPKAVWKSSAAAGMTMTSGNRDTTLATAAAGTDRKTDQNEWSLGADGAYGQSKVSGQTETTSTANSLHGFTQYNHLFTDSFNNEPAPGYKKDDLTWVTAIACKF